MFVQLLILGRGVLLIRGEIKMVLEVNKVCNINAVVENTVSSDRIVINGVYFDFDNTQATANISFYSGDVFLKNESWTISNPFYLSKISQTVKGGLLSRIILDNISSFISELLDDHDLMNSLLSSSELVIQ